ncbi:glycosyltransferase family 2 protein [Candidatus Micrarchaeota archaeon]|jgi:glycosyltransferase involved in cell wall biosynthesis|nr:glycosyltransferase family 2 protein [Candidatus Micrarchaeota archaeon]
MKLSVIVPVYNEQETVDLVLKKLVKARSVNEIIVVDDGSTDNTWKKIKKVKSKKIQAFQKENGGKGSAVRYGLKKVTGDYTLIQDADLEYDPVDIKYLVEATKKDNVEVVYGSRFIGPHSNLLFWHRLGNSLLNFFVNILYNTTLSDMETCYKLVPTDLMKSLDLKANKFDLEPEITCKILKKGVNIFEVPISYVGRSFEEGKKITWKDGFSAFWVITKLKIT